MSELLPLFVNLRGRQVLLVGAGPVGASKLPALVAAGAQVTVVAPLVHPDIDRARVSIHERPFEPSDLDGMWLVVAAATAEVNRAVARAAEARRIFVNAVDDPDNATAFLSGVVRREGVTIGISTSGDAPGLTALVRAALDDLLPADIGDWMDEARRLRAGWKRDGVPMAARRPLLLDALNRLYGAPIVEPVPGAVEPAEPVEVVKNDLPASQEGSRATGERGDHPRATHRGHVSIVGAGPGDPGLLTRTAVARLRAADVVLYDALVDQRVLRIARQAQRFFVGKRSGRHALSQAAIQSVMIRAARRGRRVVRLKGGDPFVFGRGGEEALALCQAGVPFDCVPGVTSAVAGPALAGIPVTLRGVAASVLIVSGHDEAAFRAAIGALPPHGVTLVVLMGLARRAAIASALQAAGWPAATPAAVVTGASTPRQDVWRGPLTALAETTIALDDPGLLVVGEVAAMRLASLDDRQASVSDAHELDAGDEYRDAAYRQG